MANEMANKMTKDLLEAVKEGEFEKAQDIIIAAKASDINTGLVWSVIYDRQEVFSLLLNAEGAQVNNSCLSAFYFALMLGRISMLEKFLWAGAKPNVPFSSIKQSTPLMLAVGTGIDSEQTAKLLLDAGANPLLRDDEGATALHRGTASSHMSLSACLLLLKAVVTVDLNSIYSPETDDQLKLLRMTPQHLKKLLYFSAIVICFASRLSPCDHASMSKEKAGNFTTLFLEGFRYLKKVRMLSFDINDCIELDQTTLSLDQLSDKVSEFKKSQQAVFSYLNGSSTETFIESELDDSAMKSAAKVYASQAILFALQGKIPAETEGLPKAMTDAANRTARWRRRGHFLLRRAERREVYAGLFNPNKEKESKRAKITNKPSNKGKRQLNHTLQRFA
jgi:hypothetical protein